jgi:single-strand DNA-binding protein
MRLADLVENYVKKGDKLFVEGEIQYRQYEDKDKQTRYVTEINVREVILLGGGRGGDGAASARPAKAAAGAKGGGNDAGFSEFPEAMDGDDDLPF